jgi:1,4-alpha-glucan branching enzyme
VEGSIRLPGPYDLMNGLPTCVDMKSLMSRPVPSLYQPYYVESATSLPPSTVFPRDPRTSLQVWSGELGYPGEAQYLDFHKKRWPGGHRYWQVTGAKIDMGQKMPYFPEGAAERIRQHAEHFVDLLHDALRPSLNADAPPILTSPFDAELFGHWWFEGAEWLENVARVLARRAETDELPIVLTTCGEYLDRYPRAGSVSLEEGSWGKNGSHEVWLNDDTRWTWAHIYPAEAAVRDMATDGRWRSSALGMRIARQLCRELLLMESSDWQFLITTGAARDYAEMRFSSHNNQFTEVLGMWNELTAGHAVGDAQQGRLAEIEVQDSIFAEIDPGLWARRS